MDRQSFLRCQSFLYPLFSSSVPTDSRQTLEYDSNASPKKSSCEVLLDNMNLSIEPCENSGSRKKIDGNQKCDASKNTVNGQSIAPAYFLPHKATRKTANAGGKILGPSETTNRDIICEDGEGVGDRNVDPVLTDPTFCKVQLTLHSAKLPHRGMMTPIKKNKRDLPEAGGNNARNNEAIMIANIDGKCKWREYTAPTVHVVVMAIDMIHFCFTADNANTNVSFDKSHALSHALFQVTIFRLI